MKHAIVTGATGFVGRHLIDELKEREIDIVAIVHRINDKAEKLRKSNVKVVECPMEEYERLDNILGEVPEETVFYHMAWQGTAGEDRANHALQLKNVEWTVNALLAAVSIGCEAFVGAGSIMEYESTTAVYDGNNTPGMGNIYSTAKLTAHYMSRIKASDNIRFVWPYITNSYGEDEKSERFLNTMIRRMLNQQDMTFSAATQIYDFVHINDVARAFYFAGKYGKHGKSYCIGSGKAAPLRDFIIRARDIVDPNRKLVFGERPGVDISPKHYDTSEFEEDTGYKTYISFDEGIRLMIKEMEQISE